MTPEITILSKRSWPFSLLQRKELQTFFGIICFEYLVQVLKTVLVYLYKSSAKPSLSPVSWKDLYCYVSNCFVN